MEAIVLAGGFGTRLRSVVSDVPKPMAPICDGKPFLKYILDVLQNNNVEHVVLSTAYMSEVIEKYFGDKYKDIFIDYSVENTPLLTGGAIKKSLTFCHDENVVVLNGDTFFDVNLQEMMLQHKQSNAEITMALKMLKNIDRYGTVTLSGSKITNFNEKKQMPSGYINGGIYCIKKELLDYMHETIFSFEKDVLEKYVHKNMINGYVSDGYFIDIGVPEDYLRAKEYFSLI